MVIALGNLRRDWPDTVPPQGSPESDGRNPCLVRTHVLMGRQLLPEGSPWADGADSASPIGKSSNLMKIQLSP